MSTLRYRLVLPALLFGLSCAVPAVPRAAADDVLGEVKDVSGDVVVSPADGSPFVPATVGRRLVRGAVVIVMEDSRALLTLKDRGEVTLVDNASLKLEPAVASGDYTTVTAVRAPVLFLFPTGRSAAVRPGAVPCTFGINHTLDTVRGVTTFRLYALHEDAEDELDEDAGPAAALEVATLLAEVPVRTHRAETGYTWYRVTSKPLTVEGEYTVFVVAVRGDELVRLGQSTLLTVEGDGGE